MLLSSELAGTEQVGPLRSCGRSLQQDHTNIGSSSMPVSVVTAPSASVAPSSEAAAPAVRTTYSAQSHDQYSSGLGHFGLSLAATRTTVEAKDRHTSKRS